MYSSFYHLDKLQILTKTEEVIKELERTLAAIREEDFNVIKHKYSAADYLTHIEAAFHQCWSKIFTFKFILRWKYGKPRHESFSFEQMEETFQQLDMDELVENLCNQFSSKQKKAILKEDRLKEFNIITERYLNEIRFYWEEDQMDHYQIPHEQLGLITAREWIYSTIAFCWISLHKIRKIKEDTRP